MTYVYVYRCSYGFSRLLLNDLQLIFLARNLHLVRGLSSQPCLTTRGYPGSHPAQEEVLKPLLAHATWEVVQDSEGSRAELGMVY